MKKTTPKEEQVNNRVSTGIVEPMPEVVNDTKSIRQRPRSLKQMVDSETERRKILTEFIKHHMIRGIDYGAIHINKNCEDKYNCKLSFHFSKDCLFKPGAEKFTSLLRLRVEYKKDIDTWEMLGSLPGTICYICYLLDSQNNIVGEGRGSSSVSEKGSANMAIKIAEKRSKMDAVLSTGGLSDFFTQDLDDMQEEVKEQIPSQQGYKPQYAQNLPQNRVSPVPPLIITTEDQVKIRQLMVRKGKSMEDIEGSISSTDWKNGHSKTKLNDLTHKEALLLIERMEKLPDVKQTEEEKEPEIDIDAVDKGIEEQRLKN